MNYPVRPNRTIPLIVYMSAIHTTIHLHKWLRVTYIVYTYTHSFKHAYSFLLQRWSHSQRILFLYSNQLKEVADIKLCQSCIPYGIHILCTIHYYSHVLFLNLFCQGPFRRNWATWSSSLFWIYRVTVYQVRSVSYHAREVGCCCMQWSPIAFHSKATHFIWIWSVRVYSGGTGQPDLAHWSESIG